MKAIISHDIDHITVWEHLTRDTILPKFVVRVNIELFSRKISLKEYMNRLGDFLGNKWNNIDELIRFNASRNIPGTFFIGVQNGLGLSYSTLKAAYWAKHIINQGAQLGVHGIAFENLSDIEKEYNLFKEISGLQSFGIRMHYVRKTAETFNYMAQAGYLFDSTEHAFKDPYKIGSMWEFPFQIMDGWVIEKGKRWQTQNLEQAKEHTKKIVDEAYQHQLSYLGIDFHDRYFSKSFQSWMEWYCWLIDYLKQNHISCIGFNEAIKELEK